MPIVRAITSGAAVSVTWDDGTTTSWTAQEIADLVAQHGRAGAAAVMQSALRTAAEDNLVSVTDTGDGFTVSTGDA